MHQAPGRDAICAVPLSVRVAAAMATTIRTGAETYARDIMLPRLVPVGPTEIGDETPAGRLALIERLAKALRGERARGLAGHWTYSLNRHIGLVQALAAERTALGKLVRPARWAPSKAAAGTMPGAVGMTGRHPPTPTKV